MWLQVCVGAMHPQAIASWIDSNSEVAGSNEQEALRPPLQFLGVARWGYSVRRTARKRREEINNLRRSCDDRHMDCAAAAGT